MADLSQANCWVLKAPVTAPLQTLAHGTALARSIPWSGVSCDGSGQSWAADLRRHSGSQTVPRNFGGSLPKDRLGLAEEFCPAPLTPSHPQLLLLHGANYPTLSPPLFHACRGPANGHPGASCPGCNSLRDFEILRSAEPLRAVSICTANRRLRRILIRNDLRRRSGWRGCRI